MRLREIKGEGDCLAAMYGEDAAYAVTTLDREPEKITQWLRERHGAFIRRVTRDEAVRLLNNYR